MKKLSAQLRRPLAPELDQFATLCIGITIGSLLMALTQGSYYVPLSFAAAHFIFSYARQAIYPLQKEVMEQLLLRMDALRWRGQYPPVGEATEDDVRRLLDTGEAWLAEMLYHDLHPSADARTTRRAIAQLRKDQNTR